MKSLKLILICLMLAVTPTVWAQEETIPEVPEAPKPPEAPLTQEEIDELVKSVRQQVLEALKQVKENRQLTEEEQEEKLEQAMERVERELERAEEELERSLEQAERDIEQANREVSESLRTNDGDAEEVESKNGVVFSDKKVRIRIGNENDEDASAEHPFITNDWLLLDVGINYFPYTDEIRNYPTSDTTMLGNQLEQSLGRSWYIGFSPVQMAVNLIDYKLVLRTGLTIDFHHYSFENRLTLDPDAETLQLQPLDEQLRRSTLVTNSLTLPLMLHLETNPDNRDRSFRLAAGGWAGFTFASYTKYVTEDRDKVKIKDDFNLEQVRYGLEGRIGFSHFTLFGKYDLSPLFEENKGPEIHPISVGLAVNGFSF